MSNTFILSTSTPVFLYGAASIGKIIYKRNPNLNVKGFLDVRAEEIKEFMGLPVYTPSQAAILDKESVVIVSVKNVFEHEDIAAAVYEAGFGRLIYKSKAILEGHGSIEDTKLSDIWDLLIEGCFSSSFTGLPCYQNTVKALFEDRSILAREDGDVLAYMPVEMIYTNARRDSWSDLNIQGYYPHIYFFYYLSNHKNGQIQDYLKFVEKTALEQEDIKITEAWRRNVIRNRTDVYEHMRLSLDMDPHFFHRNAPTVVWNTKGYFNLTSGKHRCAFLVSQGYRYIAVKVNEDDYQNFLAYCNPEKIRDEIIQNNSRWMDRKVYHPWFYRYPCSEPKYYSIFQVEVLCKVVRFAIEQGRCVLLSTNLNKRNSLFLILNQCRLVQMTDIETADILLLDEQETEDRKAMKQCSPCTRLWRIGSTVMGQVVAEYCSAQGAVYFCEALRWEEEG